MKDFHWKQYLIFYRILIRGLNINFPRAVILLSPLSLRILICSITWRRDATTPQWHHQLARKRNLGAIQHPNWISINTLIFQSTIESFWILSPESLWILICSTNLHHDANSWAPHKTPCARQIFLHPYIHIVSIVEICITRNIISSENHSL